MYAPYQYSSYDDKELHPKRSIWWTTFIVAFGSNPTNDNTEK